MAELIFNKTPYGYTIDIKLLSRPEDSISMSLDTGSPITTICMQNLIEISKETRMTLINKVDAAIEKKNYIEFGVYGSQDHNINRRFVPYLLDNVVIGGQKFAFFLFWLDVTNYKTQTAITSTLFGFDYIKQGLKSFDDQDNFHIKIDNGFNIDIGDLDGVLSHYKNEVCSLREIESLEQSMSL